MHQFPIDANFGSTCSFLHALRIEGSDQISRQICWRTFPIRCRLATVAFSSRRRYRQVSIRQVWLVCPIVGAIRLGSELRQSCRSKFLKPYSFKKRWCYYFCRSKEKRKWVEMLDVFFMATKFKNLTNYEYMWSMLSI